MVIALIQATEEVRRLSGLQWGRALGLPILDETDLDERGLYVLAVLLLAWVAYRVLVVILRRIERSVVASDPGSISVQEQRVWTLVSLVRSVGVVFIALIAFFMILDAFGLDIRPLLAGAGVAGLAISFGAQSLVRDVISGVFILFENQFGVGDVIRIGNVSGRVERLTLRIVVMRDDKGVHIIPNGEIKQVTNLTRVFSREMVDISVAYTADLERALELMREVAASLWADPQWRALLTEEISVAGVEALGEGSVRLRMVVTTIPLKQFDVSREIRRRVKRRFDEEGIEFPHPQPAAGAIPPAAAPDPSA